MAKSQSLRVKQPRSQSKRDCRHIGTVNRDLSYLSQQAQDNLKMHIQQRLPEQYQKCMTGLNQVLKVGWDIVHSDSSVDRLAALSLINDSYKDLMDLTTNGVVITDAIKFIQTNKEKLMSAKEGKNRNRKQESQIKQQIKFFEPFPGLCRPFILERQVKVIREWYDVIGNLATTANGKGWMIEQNCYIHYPQLAP